MPNILAPLIVVATLEFGLMILFEAGLSFLGLGVQPPTPSWGSIMSVGRNYIGSAWWIATLPGIALFLVVLSVNVIGDHMRDRFDPRSISR
jgi:peptide/nickel transport system permease protein